MLSAISHQAYKTRENK